MKLPMQQITMYELTIPSTGKKVKYRPFTVKEEKVLLIAQQSENMELLVSALKEIIRNCTLSKVDPDKLALFDLEYIMTTIRTVSVGEQARITLQCDKDPRHPPITITLDLTQIKIETDPKHTAKIPLFGDVGVMMKYPSLKTSQLLERLDTDTSVIFEIITECIDYIYDSKNIHRGEDQTPAELNEFIEGLTKAQFEKLEEFFLTMPKFRHTIEYTCSECGQKHKKSLEGISNFF